MRHVGVREFKDKATALLGAGETLVIERHGKPVGFYIPMVAKDRAAGREALERLGETIEAILERTGLTEDDLVAALVPSEEPGDDDSRSRH
jgi:antitoxin (DNA-binding transcriptional repressor) of toxin-antitoxin stability system